MENEIDVLIAAVADRDRDRNDRDRRLPAGVTRPLCISCHRPTPAAVDDAADAANRAPFPATLPTYAADGSRKKTPTAPVAARPASAPPRHHASPRRWGGAAPLARREPPRPLEKMEMYIDAHRPGKRAPAPMEVHYKVALEGSGRGDRKTLSPRRSERIFQR